MPRARMLLIIFLLSAPHVFAFPVSDIWYSEFSEKQHTFYLEEEDPVAGQLFLTYSDEGPRDGKVVLLVHGVPTSSWSYRILISILADFGYRVIAPDNLGFGNSAKPSGNQYYNLEKQASRLHSLMEHLGITSWLQVLHDVGGPITWEMLGIAPDKIEGLIILNTFAYEDGWDVPKFMDNPLVQFAMNKLGFRNRTIIRNTVCGMLVITETLDNDISLSGYYEPLENGADRAYLDFLSSFPDVRERLPYYKDVLSRISVPAIVIWGANDKTLVGEEAIPLLQRDLKIPDENVFLRSDAKHLIYGRITRVYCGENYGVFFGLNRNVQFLMTAIRALCQKRMNIRY
jgi:haloalkane dehalogenase